MSNSGLSTVRDVIVNYNNCFNPYVCHVCKISENLHACHWCRLISYCSKEHLQLHREQHKEFCLAVLSLSDEIYYSHDITLTEWTEFKKINVRKVKNKLGRDLEPYEEQILLFAKSCLICRRQNDLSVVCNICMSVSMCYRHISTPYVHNCKYLRLCKKLDINKGVINEQNVPIPIDLLTYENLSDMKTYLRQHLGRSRDYNTWNYVDFLYTNYFSRPLTLLFHISRTNIQRLTFSSIFIIHVIAGSFTDRNSLLAWEVFVHQIYPDSTLFVIMIEPNLEKNIYKISLCQTCRTKNKELYFVYCSMTYGHYRYSRLYLEPHLIVGFNIDFENDGTAIVATLMCQKKPLFLTCKSESKAQQVVTKIDKILHKKPIINEKNKFASCRPHRDVESDSVIFFHQYLIVYAKKAYKRKNLDTSSNHNQPSTSSNSFDE
ncbi:uncharacterized protein LOC116846883 [Odontomachus brunneus]|uniref:uncharacterized protein LOC116846883 n=1 Tax=Odontomachus brunneus TaxID=486640 RepID=UPI0013F260B2|nr:uncharacterized protein LOC116846883 [Odontomachus brunneus]